MSRRRSPSAAGPPRVWEALARRARPYRVALIASLLLGGYCMGQVLQRAGEPALPLDDSFIHLQYARHLSRGEWFQYSADAGYSAGATSLLWPMLLAPFFWLGLDGLALVWVAWALGTLFHAGVIVETYRLAAGLTDRATGVGAGAMCAVFGAFAWYAWSGMETIAFAWALVRCARVASEACEATSLRPGRRRELVAMGVLAPLIRPEGIAGAAMVAVAVALLVWRGDFGRRRWRWLWPLVPFGGSLVVPLSHWTFTGRASSATAMVKWLPHDPYLDRAGLFDEIYKNVHLLVTDLLDGGGWTTVFLPEHFVWALMLGLLVMPLLAWQRRRGWRALFATGIVAATLLPCSYSTLLWNRVRYIWPFATGWFVAVACLTFAVGALLSRARPLFAIAAPVLMGAAVAALLAKLPWGVRDLAQSARAIARQQVTLGRWAARKLPQDARVGVNDTGAIAFMSGRRTFDVVGLTTRGEARHWALGSGSRFEHYERLPRSELPTHFIVYRQWMSMDVLLGDWLTEATVIDQSILGGRTMSAYRARYDALGSGALPWAIDGAPAEELDVSDAVSESAHRYSLRFASSGYNAVRSRMRGGRQVTDGGRRQRLEDRFELELPLRATTMVMRVGGSTSLEVWMNGKQQVVVHRPANEPTQPWHERVVRLPSAATSPQQIVVRPTERGARFDSFHYWWF